MCSGLADRSGLLIGLRGTRALELSPVQCRPHVLPQHPATPPILCHLTGLCPATIPPLPTLG